MDLHSLRSEIDDIDRTLLDLFQQRMDVVAAIARCKREQGLPIRYPAREDAVLARIRAAARPELADYAAAFFQSLMAISRQMQQDRLGE